MPGNPEDTAATSVSGHCLCGRVHFAVDRPLPNLYRCHCSLCRLQGGAAANAATLVPSERFRWLEGETAVTRWQRSTGFSSHFCSDCGSPVPNRLQSTGWTWIPAGLLEDVDGAQVVAHLCVASRAPWDRVTETDVVAYEDCPEFEVLTAALRRNG